MLKRVLASILIFPFLLVPLVCCCTPVHAASTQTEHCDDSDHTASAGHQEHSKSNHSHADCDCHSLSTATEKVSSVQINFLAFPKVFPATDIVTLKSFIYPKSSLRLAYLGPPIGLSAVVPLYTLYHSLRI